MRQFTHPSAPSQMEWGAMPLLQAIGFIPSNDFHLEHIRKTTKFDVITPKYAVESMVGSDHWFCILSLEHSTNPSERKS